MVFFFSCANFCRRASTEASLAENDDDGIVVVPTEVRVEEVVVVLPFCTACTLV